MQFQPEVEKEMLGAIVTELNLLVAPSVLVCARFERIIGIENATVEGLSAIVFDRSIRFKVLDGIVQVKTYMIAECEIADDTFGLQAHTGTQTIGHTTFREVGFAEICGVSVPFGSKLVAHCGIGSIIEEVGTQAYTEDSQGLPIA